MMRQYFLWVLVFSIFVLIGYAGQKAFSMFAAEQSKAVDLDVLYEPTYKQENGREVVMVYITAPHCRFCSSPTMPALVEKSKMVANKIASEYDAHISVVGIAVAWSVREGLEHLERFGLFDEVMTGKIGLILGY